MTGRQSKHILAMAAPEALKDRCRSSVDVLEHQQMRWARQVEDRWFRGVDLKERISRVSIRIVEFFRPVAHAGVLPS